MTNGAGATTGTYEYDVFGETSFKYTGRQSDEGTGLYYLRARYYDPNTGRFPSTDPFPGPPASPQTQNPYAHVSNKPANATDPSGEVPPVVAWCFVETVAGAVSLVSSANTLKNDHSAGKEEIAMLGPSPTGNGM